MSVQLICMNHAQETNAYNEAESDPKITVEDSENPCLLKLKL